MDKINIKNIIGSIMVVLGLIAGVLAFDDRYASSSDLMSVDKKYDGRLKGTEMKLVQTLDKFVADSKQEKLEQRYINLTDQAMQLKILKKKNPRDAELAEDYNRIEAERQEVKRKLEEKR